MVRLASSWRFSVFMTVAALLVLTATPAVAQDWVNIFQDSGNWTPTPIPEDGDQALGQTFEVTQGLQGIGFQSPTWNGTGAGYRMRLFAWDTDYATSVAGTVLGELTVSDHPDNAWVDMVLDPVLAPGQYLAVTDQPVRGSGNVGHWGWNDSDAAGGAVPGGYSNGTLIADFEFQIRVAEAEYVGGEGEGEGEGEITAGNTSTGLNDAVASSLTFDHQLPSGDNRMVLVFAGREEVEANIANAAVNSVTFNGAAMTHVAGTEGRVGAAFQAHTDIFYILEADLPGAGTYPVVITCAGDTANIEAAAISIIGAEQGAPEAAANNSSEDGSPITTSITTQTDGAWVMDIVMSGAGDDGPGDISTTASGMTEAYEVVGPSSAIAGAIKLAATAGATDMGWEKAGTSNRFAHSVVAVAPAPAGPVGPQEVILHFSCDEEGFVSNGKLAFTQNIGSLTVVPTGGDPFMNRATAIDGTALQELAMQLNVTGSPGGAFPAAFFWFADGGHGRAGFQLDGDGDYTVRMNVPGAKDSGAASWDASVHTIRLDFPDGDATAFINAGTMFTLDWLTITDDPNYTPPIPNDGVLDCDGDGLSNNYEQALGTDPFNPDSDGDGVDDGLEVQYGTDPLDSEEAPTIPASSALTLMALAIALAMAGVFTCRRRRTA